MAPVSQRFPSSAGELACAFLRFAGASLAIFVRAAKNELKSNPTRLNFTHRKSTMPNAIAEFDR
jgi:hypothetical protein